MDIGAHDHSGGTNGVNIPVTSLSGTGTGGGLDADLLDGQESSWHVDRTNHTGTQAPGTISPQGAASGLDADLLDGVEASALQLRSEKDAANGYAGLDAGTKLLLAQMTGVMASSDLTNDAALEKTANKGAANGYASLDATTKVPLAELPTGSGNGLDADTVDGSEASALLARANHTGTQAPATISPQGAASGLDADTVDGNEASALLARANHTGTQAPATISPQGAASGLDADTVDGVQASAFELGANKGAASGYAGLDSGGNLTRTLMTSFDGKRGLTTVTASASTVDVDADFLTVEGVPLSSVNLTADITASGANGLDTGVEAANTWYALFVITDDTGSINASLLSTSATAPTLPGSYTRKRRVGWVRNDASSDFIDTERFGNWVYWNETSSVTEILNTSTAATTFTDVNCSAFVPSTSRLAKMSLSAIHTAQAGAAGIQIRPDGWAANDNLAELAAGDGANTDNQVQGSVDCPLSATQIIEYQSNQAETARININAYYDEV